MANNSHYPIDPDEPAQREERLTALIDQLETLIDDHTGHVSGHAIYSLGEAREELSSELSLLQRGII